MRSTKAFAPLLAILFALTICVSNSYGQETESDGDQTDFAKEAKMLHGVWSCDTEKTAEEIKNMKDFAMEDGMLEMILERVKTIELEFQDGTFQVDIGDQSMAGDWKVTKAGKNDEVQTITINVTPNDESEGDEKTFEIHFMGDDNMKMIDLGEESSPPLVMARKAVRDKDQ